MKEIYEAPSATVINLAAVEKLALLDGHSDEGVNPIGGDVPDATTSVGSGRPGGN